MTMNEPNNMKIRMVHTMHDFFVLSIGVKWRFSQIMSDGSDAY